MGGRHRRDNAFRLTVTEDRPLALAPVSVLLLLGVLERISKGIALRRIHRSGTQRGVLKQAIILHANI